MCAQGNLGKPHFELSSYVLDEGFTVASTTAAMDGEAPLAGNPALRDHLTTLRGTLLEEADRLTTLLGTAELGKRPEPGAPSSMVKSFSTAASCFAAAASPIPETAAASPGLSFSLGGEDTSTSATTTTTTTTASTTFAATTSRKHAALSLPTKFTALSSRPAAAAAAAAVAASAAVGNNSSHQSRGQGHRDRDRDLNRDRDTDVDLGDVAPEQGPDGTRRGSWALPADLVLAAQGQQPEWTRREPTGSDAERTDGDEEDDEEEDEEDDAVEEKREEKKDIREVRRDHRPHAAADDDDFEGHPELKAPASPSSAAGQPPSELSERFMSKGSSSTSSPSQYESYANMSLMSSQIEAGDGWSAPPANTQFGTGLSHDVLDMEDMWAQDMAKRAAELEEQNQTAPNKERQTLADFVSSNRFEAFVVVAVFANALLIGIEVEVSSLHPGEDSHLAFIAVQHMFTLLFAVELILRIKAFGVYNNFIRNGLSSEWFDLFIVISSMVELFSDIMYLSGSGKGSGVPGVSQLRMARIVKVTKLLRTFRIQRIIRIIAPLRTLVFSIFVTLKSLAWAMSLLALIIYVVAVIVVQTVTTFRATASPAEAPLRADLEEYFMNLERAMWTLLQSISGGISWRDCGLPLVELSPWTGIVFTIFVCFIYFAVLNVVTAVFCSSAIETTQRTPEVIATAMITHKNEYEKNLRQLFSKLDRDCSGKLTLGELQAFLDDEVLHAQLAALEIEVSDAWSLFRLLDREHKGVINLEEFVQGCMTLKGGAKGIDIASLQKEVKSLHRSIYRMNKSMVESARQNRMMKQTATYVSELSVSQTTSPNTSQG